MNRICFLFFLFAFFTNIFSQDRNIPPEQPMLVVGIIVSEMRYEYLNRYWDMFSEGGFKKLVSTGTVFRNAHHDYLLAESGAGYASIATGAYPDVHGIVANFWYERLKENTKYCIGDDNIQTIGGNYESGKYSPSNLLALNTSDQLKLSSNFASKVFSVSLDPVGAVISGGHTADAAYWYDNYSGKWITSSYYCDSLPQWVNEFNSKDIAGIYLSRTWETKLPIDKYLNNFTKNQQEKGFSGIKGFPYDLNLISMISKKERNYSVLKETPFGNTYTKDMAISIIINEELGKNLNTDWLNVCFSGTSYAGKNFMPLSVEMQDLYLRLDEDIAHFLSFLDENIGLKNVLIFFTAENAIANEPSYLQEHKMPGGYFNYNSAISLLTTYLNVIYGTGDWVKFYYSQQIYLNRELIEDSRLSLAEFQDRVARFMVQFEGVSSALTAENLMTNNYTHGIFEKMQKNYHQERSGDIILGLSPGWIEKGIERATASSFRYDTHIPLVFYGWKTGRSVITRDVSVTDIAPTLAVLLNISRPQSAQGKVIEELIR